MHRQRRERLASCYRRAIEIAAAHRVRTLAFPCISTGVYGYPIKPAAKVAVATVQAAAREHVVIGEVVFCCFSPADLATYTVLLRGHED